MTKEEIRQLLQKGERITLEAKRAEKVVHNRRNIRAMEEKPDVTFENFETAHEFVTIIKRKVVESDQESDRVTNQVTNGVANGVANEITNEVANGETRQVERQAEHQVEHQVEHQEKTVKISLTGSQKDIVNFCSVPRSAQEILDRVGVTNQTFNRKKHILPLVEKGVLEMTNPENPSASNQKYRKVRKG